MKKIVALALFAFVTSTLVGCGGTTTASSVKSTTTTTTTAKK